MGAMAHPGIHEVAHGAYLTFAADLFEEGALEVGDVDGAVGAAAGNDLLVRYLKRKMWGML